MDTLLPLTLLLTSVIVYPEGARYRYAGTLAAKKGLNYLVWTELPPEVDFQSVKAAVSPSARGYIVQSGVEPQTPLRDKLPPDIENLRHKVDSFETLLGRVRQRLTVLNLQQRALEENIHLRGDEGQTHPEDVEKYVLLIERRLTAILEEKMRLLEREKVLSDSLSRWKEAYEARLSGWREGRAAFFLTYWTPQSEVIPIRIELSGPPASWSLRYRISAEPTSGKVILQRWALVQNLSGMDWRNVQLTLSTGRPARSGEMPPFLPWYVDIAPSPVPVTKGIGAEPRLYRLQAEGAEITTEEEPSPSPIPLIAEQTLSRSYDLSIQTILAGARTSLFFLKADTLEAVFRFFVNASAEETAYLRAALPMAALSFWEAAPATIEVDGQEVAQINWPPTFTDDTLWMDLGPAPRLQVKRNQTQNRRESRPASPHIHHTFAYELRLSHTYPAPIQIVVWDRIPISRHSDIKVELLDSGGATVDVAEGRLRWDFSLASGELWSRSFRFVIKYPKKKPIIGL